MNLLHHGYTTLGQYVPEVLSPTSAEKTLHGHCYATHRIAVTQLAALKPPLPITKQVLQRQSPAEFLFSAMVTPFVTSCVYCIALAMTSTAYKCSSSSYSRCTVSLHQPIATSTTTHPAAAAAAPLAHLQFAQPRHGRPS